MSRHTLIFTTFCSMLAFFTSAQNVDSLKQEIIKCSLDYCKAKQTYNLCEIYLSNNLDSASHYETLNRAFSEKTELPDLIIKNLFLQVAIQSQRKNYAACDSLYSLMYVLIKEHQVERDYLHIYFGSRGAYYQRRSMLDSAIVVYQKALEDIDTSFKDYYKLHYKILGNIGKLERKRGNFKTALAFYEKAQLNLEKNAFSFKEKFNIFKDIGYLYRQLGNYESSLYYYEKARENVGILPDNKAIIYRELGELYALKKDTINTLAYIDSLSILYGEVSYKNQCKLAYSLLQMNAFLYKLETIPDYMDMLEECYRNNKTNKSDYWAAKAKYHYANEEYAIAFEYFEKLHLYESNSGTNKLKGRLSTLNNLIKTGILADVDKGKLDQYFWEYHLLQDSIRAILVQEEVEKFNARYQTRIKQDSIQILQLQTQKQAAAIRNRNFGIGVAVLLLFLAAWVIHLHRQNAKKEKAINALLKKEKAELIFEKKELKSLNAALQEKVAILKQEGKKNILQNKLELKSANKTHLVDVPTIRYIKAEYEGCRLYLKDNSIWVENPLKKLLGQLPKDSFARIYRSTVVNLSFIDWVNHSSLKMQDGTELRIGRTYKEEILERFKS